MTDNKSTEFLNDFANDFKNKKLEIISVDVPSEYSCMQTSRYLKTSLREYIDGDYLYIDTDTVFADQLPPNISDDDLCLARDCNYEVFKRNTFAYDYWKPLYSSIGIDDVEGKIHFNSGIIWAKDTKKVRAFYDDWHKMWKNNLTRNLPNDQLALNIVNWNNGFINDLNQKFNYQIAASESVNFRMLGEAIIIHYFHRGNRIPFLLSKSYIINLPYNDEVIQSIIKSPKTAFDGCILSSSIENEIKLYNSFSFQILKRIYYRHRKIFDTIEHLSHVLKKIVTR